MPNFSLESISMCEHSKAPLYVLTIEEYVRLSRKLISEEIKRLLDDQNNANSAKEQPDVIFIDEAARLTGYKPTTIYTKVSRIQMPVVTRGRPLTFSRKVLLQWIEGGKPDIIDQQAGIILSDKIGRRHDKSTTKSKR